MPFGLPGNPFGQQELWERSWAVTIGTSLVQGIKITEQDIAFKIEKSTKDEPNTCELSIWNLNEDHRAAIEELNPPVPALSAFAPKAVRKLAEKKAVRGIPVKIEAGFGDDLSLLWLGDLRTAHSIHDGTDWITVLESGDGEKAWKNARANVSFGPKTPKDVALRALARAMGVGEGNLSMVVAKMRISGALYPQGSVFSGPVAPMISEICKAADLEWSIQDGALQFIDRGKALLETAILVSASTGMLGSPTVDVDGILTVNMLMVPGLRPGRLLVIDSDRVKGGYRAEKITWTADSAGSDWNVEIQASRY